MKKMMMLLIMMAIGVMAQNVNLVKNGSFETLDDEGYPVGWSKHADTWASSTENKQDGARSFLHFNTKPGQYQFVSQPIKVETGKSYEFSIKYKLVVADNTDARAKKAKANLFLEYYNEKDYLGGAYSPTSETLNTDWNRLRGRAVIPAGATRVSVGFRATPDGVAGVKIWFDDCVVQEYIPDPLSNVLTTDCYRDEAAGGPVTVFCGRNRGNAAITESDLWATMLTCERADGTVVFSTKPAAVQEDRFVYQFDADTLPVGSYNLICRLTDSKRGKSFTAQHAFKRLAVQPNYKCYVDKQNRLVLDGKLFFPLGMYFSTVDPKADWMAKYVDSKFNCLMPYNSPKNIAVLDYLQEKNIKVFYSIKDLVSARGNAAETTKKQAQGLAQLNAVKHHPAIALWYINDELDEAYVGDALQYRQACEINDPSRPTWSVLCIPDQFRTFTCAADIHGCDPYPIPSGTPARAYQWTKQIKDATMGSKLVIQVPQAFCWGRYWVKYGHPMDKCNACRRPTFEEIDAMSWMCIAGGANGLVYYSYFDLVQRDKPIGELKPIPFDEHFGDCKKVAERIHAHERVLLADNAEKAYTVKNDTSAVFRAYSLNGETWILAVNTSEKAETTFELATAKPMKLLETTLSQPKVNVNGTAVSATLQPLQAVFLRMK